MRDIQSEVDERGVRIDRVGITGLRYPVRFVDREIDQRGFADLEITVELDPDQRATHMSRMVEIVRDQMGELDPRRLPIVLKAGADVLDAPGITIRADLSFATLTTAPASLMRAHQVHGLCVAGMLDRTGIRVECTVTADVTTLCPCSKAISDYGAHNQRSVVRLCIAGDGDDPYPLPVTTAVDMIRQCGSAPVYPLVKRADERHITMQAFDHPVFVEDIVRDLSLLCDQRGLRHRIEVQSRESIHSHDAVASIDRMERPARSPADTATVI